MPTKERKSVDTISIFITLAEGCVDDAMYSDFIPVSSTYCV